MTRLPSSLSPALLAACVALPACGAPDTGPPTASAIRHVLVIIQENHTFDAYFGRYCTAPAGSSPGCTAGPACCEAAPAAEPGSGAPPTALTDDENAAYSPDHDRDCELDEMDGGKMDRFVTSALCGSRRNFAVATDAARPYWDLAQDNALADRYFPPLAGASSANDMYFARARHVFDDNDFVPKAVGTRCTLPPQHIAEYTDPTLGDLLGAAGVPWGFYAEGYQDMIDASQSGSCPAAPDACALGAPLYPCIFDPSDVPFEYYPSLRDDPAHMKDLSLLSQDLDQGPLPAVVFVKALGYRTEHPGLGVTIRDGTAFVTGLLDAVRASRYGQSTLVLLAWDEGGGYFDHVAPPGVSAVDGQPYGARLPFLAIGPFARKGGVAHAPLEHSSVVRFIEWNWLGATGQLGGRDAVVNNLGDLLDPGQTGTPVPGA